MSFRRSVVKHDNVIELRVMNTAGTILYALIVSQYGIGDLSSGIVEIRAINFKLTNSAFRYELSRFANLPVNSLEADTAEDLFEFV